MTKELTNGHPLKIIFNFAVPVFLGFLFQQFYNLVDTIIVGRFLGVDALAAVGATGSLNFMIIGFCMGICSGFAIPVAQTFGGGNIPSMKQFVFCAWILTAVFSVALTVPAVISCRKLLELLKTPQNILDLSSSYFSVILSGIPAVLLYNFLSGIIRSVGDSKTPLFFLIFSAILNIVLDIVFIALFKTGIKGAAWATVLSQGTAGIFCFFFMKKHLKILSLEKSDRKISIKKINSLLGIGIPMGLQYSITAIGSVILQWSVNILGSIYVASMATAQKISIFFSTPFDALGTTMATYGGQNVGAHKFERLNSGLFWACLLGAVYSVLGFLCLWLFSDSLTSLFINPKESLETVLHVKENVRFCLLATAAFYFFLALVNIVRFMIQGMGFSKFAVLAGVFELVGRAVIGFVFVPKFGFKAACLASPLAWILADSFLVPAYFWCRKKLMELK